MKIKILLIVIFLTATAVAYGERVDVKEAKTVADLWYAMEINSEHTKMDPQEKTSRLARMKSRKVRYLVAADDLRDDAPKDGKVLAYVVEYKPAGYVIVTGEDRIKPVLAFGASSAFRFDNPERNYMRHFLDTALCGRFEALEDQDAKGIDTKVHDEWSWLRAKLRKGTSLKTVTFGSGRGGRDTYAHHDTALWDQYWPYNETVVLHNGNIPNIPTGCTATAMAIKMRFHEWPVTGNGDKSYFDNSGSVQFNHYVNYGVYPYDWSQMPTTQITSSNLYVAHLMYHCGVCTEMNYEVNSSNAWLIPSYMQFHFRYKGTESIFTNHEPYVKASVIGGLPAILSSQEHTVVCDGYRDTPSPYFHLNVGYNGYMNDWYDISMIPGGSGPHPIVVSYPYSCPDNYIYVDGSQTGLGNGSLQDPFVTLAEGAAVVPAWGKLMIAAGVYTGTGNTPITLDQAVTLEAYGGDGTVVIIK